MKVNGIEGADLIREVFSLLRGSGFNLGIDEYLAGVALVSDQAASLPFIHDLESLKQALKLIWCSSQSEQRQFEPVWDKALSAIQTSSQVVYEDDTHDVLSPPPPKTNLSRPIRTEQPATESLIEKNIPPELDAAPQPVRAPFTPAEIEHTSDLQSYWPVSRRSLSYNWRYLRRTVEEGPADIVDVAATVQQSAQQGFYLKPVMRQRDCNRAQLLLFVDQNGSMMPLHQFTREVVETALYESGLPDGQVTVCYFQNVPADSVYRDVFLTQPVTLNAVLAACDSNTSALIVSDAGAARRALQLERVRATARFLRRLRQTTQLCAWLNPIPVERWGDSSAELIANLVPMFQMDDDGLSNAIDVVRGLLVQSAQP